MKTYKIGTRNSPLAMWQAEFFAQKLNDLGLKTQICPILSSGDKNLSQPLYALGITGMFTKDLDVALINGEIDFAVHSLKDVPTKLPQNIEISCYLPRDFEADVLVRGPQAKDKNIAELSIATSSLRRRAFWLQHYPNTQFTDIRGNVQTRLQKLEDGVADATLFSLAGFKRLQAEVAYEHLDFMIPAPAQGVMAVCSRISEQDDYPFLAEINHQDTQKCVEIEREFLSDLEGGCTAPIGALAKIDAQNRLHFKGRLNSLEGKNSLEIDEICHWEANLGKKFSAQMKAQGGLALMQAIKQNLKSLS
jgi:hydroxymethylbilane synthase